MGDRWIDQTYYAELLSIYSQCERNDNPAKLLNSLLTCTFWHLENNYMENPTELKEKILNTYQTLQIHLENQTIKGKIKTHDKNMAIGKIIHDLNFLGMPRIAAIKATAKWLNIGESTVRTYNENYRLAYPNLKTEFALKLSSYNRDIKKMIEENPDFPCDHVKAKSSFEKYLGILNQPEPQEMDSPF